MIGFIYKYTSPSGKSYIGQTVKTIEQRAKYTGEGYKKCPIFYRAILKYGFENFTCEILEQIEAQTRQELKEKLNILEQKYIIQYKTLAPFGYNVRSGGELDSCFSKESKVCTTGSQHFNWRSDLDEEKIRQLYESGLTLKNISEYTGISKGTIKRHVQDMGILKEKKYNQPVVKIDKNGNILKRWESASEAERDEGKSKNSIGRCCRERRRPYKGITYRFEGESL